MRPEPVRRQRFAAYALVRRVGPEGPEVLLTQLSARTSRAGAWTLPGGGIEHGEDPRDAVVREVREETGLDVAVGRLLDVHSMHHVGPSPTGAIEDYHAIRLVFEATVSAEAPDPRVQEVGGTTASARWLPEEAVEGDSGSMVGLVGWALRAAGGPPSRHRSAGAAAGRRVGTEATQRPEHVGFDPPQGLG